MTLFVTVILGLILVILGLSAEWPLWAWPTVAALMLVIAAVTDKVLAPAPEPFPRRLGEDPDLPLPEPQRQEHRITHVALPSSVPDYDFSFSATVRWLMLDAPADAPHVNAAGLAVDAVLQRARAVTAQQPPHRSAFCQHQLDGALATMRPDPTGRVTAMAQNVSLVLPEHDRERLAKLSDVRKDEDVWEHERNYERSKRAYLGDDVLKNTGSAVVWWLSRNDDKVEDAVDRIGLLARLSAAANNEEVAPPFAHLAPQAAAGGGTVNGHAFPYWQRPHEPTTPVPDADPVPDLSVDTLLAWFGVSPADPDFDLFAERLLKLAETHGAAKLTEELRQRFGPGPGRPDDPDGGDPSAADGSGPPDHGTPAP
ncbi:hypothetical protein [Streptomyces fumanus]|uniref:Uncharacterized protein n=1 Tax=Streptomyces fumanus TaxID=67302 RepID=A0A919E5X7_9ACTN|nr:hypothetical protein [Streptomyces fumanus]GHF17214.1 hypothetical protein GCM10018772_48080 [Streptomyces fumanus]